MARDVASRAVAQRVRLADVAAASHVSIATASRALAGSGNVSRAAVTAVLAAAERLGYRPDPIARAMRSRQTGLVGIVIPGVANPFFAEVIEALENAMQTRGLDMLLADSRGSVVEESRRLEMLLDRKVDGMFVIPSDEHASALAIRGAQRYVPVVQIDRRVDGVAGDYVGIDNACGIRALLEHLATQGCRRVAFVSDRGLSSTGRRRLEAFRSEVRRAAGIRAMRPVLGTFSAEFGREAAVRLLRQRPLPDAVVCGADVVALGVLKELHAQRVAIPDDILVSGFDGISFAELCDPPLTTVRQPVEAIASEAVGLLWSRLNDDRSAPRHHEIAPILEVRRSSSCA